ncbi:MAG: phasin family protein [Verrucomicrobiales bacterium]|nr:phasin family protein [Verrucomicrobiales bacterium]
MPASTLPSLDFTAPQRLNSSLSTLKPPQFGTAIATTFQQSQGNALQLTAALVAAGRPFDNSREIVQWAGGLTGADAPVRRMIVQAFRQQSQQLLLVHRLAALPPEQTKSFLADYLAAGGEASAIADWLRLAGKALRAAPVSRGRKTVAKSARGKVVSRGTRGLFDDVWGALSSAGSAVVDLVKNVADAVIDGAKSLGGAIAEIAKKAIGDIADFIEALVRAGRSLASIFAEAAKKGLDTLKKFVNAALEAGRALAEIVGWAATQVLETAKAVLSELLRLGKKLADVLVSAVRLAASALQNVLRALVALGKKVAEFIDAVARNLMDSARTVLEGLLQIGIRLADVVKSILVDILEASRRGLFEALLAIGKTPLALLQAAAEAGGSVLFLAITVLFEIWGGYRSLTAQERREALRIFGASIDLDRVKVAAGNVPAEVANWINGQTPFTTMYLMNFSKKDSQRTDEGFLSTLIHEMTHIWQGVQVGPLYMLQSVCSQFQAVLNGGDRNAAYIVTEEALAANKGKFSKFNREQQATIVEYYWIRRFSTKLSTSGLPSLDLLAPYATQVFKPVRAKAPVRSRSLSRGGIRPTLGTRRSPRAISIPA